MNLKTLRTVLILTNLALVALAVGLVVVPASGMLRRLFDERARDRVSLAAATATRSLDRWGADTLTQARLLAERPTLARLVDEADAPALRAYLDQFAKTAGFSGCAVVAGGSIVAATGEARDWEPLTARDDLLNRTSLLASDSDRALRLVAASPVPARPAVRVLVTRRLDRSLLARLGLEAGLPVALLTRRDAESAGPDFTGSAEDLRATMRAQALATREPLARRTGKSGPYVALQPVGTAPEGPAGLLEVTMPAAEADAPVRAAIRSLLALALGVALLAILLGVLLALSVARPLEALTKAAVRISRGDFTAAVPRADGGEPATLAKAVEAMRGRLATLTAERQRGDAEAGAVLSGILEGVFAVDAHRRIVYMNPQAASLLDTTREAAIGRFCGDVLDARGPDGRRPCEEHCPIVDARSRGSARATERLALPGGRMRTVVIAASAPADSAGIPGHEARQFQVMRDETDIEASRRLRDAVLANISHEFRTPLAAQLASIELLGDRITELTHEETRSLVLSLQRGTLRLTQLIDNLLESVRIESGQESVRRRAVDLDEVIEEAVALTASLLDQRNQLLSVDLPHPLPIVMGDAPRLVQVFVNLIANANKFAPSGTPIIIGGSVGDTEVALWVEDRGPGLPHGDRPFEPFVRTVRDGDEEEPESGGMGLGLWIVRSIVQRHGGRIEITPARDGAVPGTRIAVVLPYATSQA